MTAAQDLPFPAGAVLMITGIMGAGKSTVAQLLAERLPRSAHVRGDAFRRMIVGGRVEMVPAVEAEALAQLELRYELASQVADGYAEAGFTAVYQDIVLGDDLERVADRVRSRPLFVVVLAPTPEAVLRRAESRSKVSGYGDWTVEDLDEELRASPRTVCGSIRPTRRPRRRWMRHGTVPPKPESHELMRADAARISAYLDAEAPPGEPTAHIVFGTNQPIPAELVAARHHGGLAPMIILTGGVNRHTGMVESAAHRRVLLELGVDEAAIRHEATSLTTRGNVEHAMPFVEETLESGLGLTAVCKWYHRRALHLLRTFLPDVPRFHAVTWEPMYDGAALTRSNWWRTSPAAVRRVLHEWRAVREGLNAGTLAEVERIDGAWR